VLCRFIFCLQTAHWRFLFGSREQIYEYLG
jgi:hypothetical protein